MRTPDDEAFQDTSTLVNLQRCSRSYQPEAVTCEVCATKANLPAQVPYGAETGGDEGLELLVYADPRGGWWTVDRDPRCGIWFCPKHTALAHPWTATLTPTHQDFPASAFAHTQDSDCVCGCPRAAHIGNGGRCYGCVDCDQYRPNEGGSEPPLASGDPAFLADDGAR